MTKAAPVRRMVVGALVALVALGAVACGRGGGAPSTVATGPTAPAASVSAGAAVNTASAPGITPTSVTIGSHQALTGDEAPGYSEIAPAAEAYFRYIDARGGINGRSINDVYLNDGSLPANSLSDVKTLVTQDDVFAIFNGLGTPTHRAVVPFLTQSKVPDLFVASGCPCWNDPGAKPETFAWQPDYTVEGKILGHYIEQKYPGQKVAVFAEDDELGMAGLAGLEAQVPASDLATVQMYDPTTSNVVPMVERLQSSGAQIVVSFSVPEFTAALQLAALRLKYQPQLIVSDVGSDPTTLAGLLTAAAKKAGSPVDGESLIQGIVTDTYLASPADPDNTWIRLFSKIRKQYLPNDQLDLNVEYGMAAAYTFAQALQAAGQNPTRASIVAAIEHSHLTGPGLTPFGYSTTSHSGYTGAQIAIVQGLVATPVGAPWTTDGGSGPVVPYTAPQPRAPASGVPST